MLNTKISDVKITIGRNNKYEYYAYHWITTDNGSDIIWIVKDNKTYVYIDDIPIQPIDRIINFSEDKLIKLLWKLK